MIGRTEVGNSRFVIYGKFFPVAKASSSELVAQQTEGRIRHKPVLIGADKRFECTGTANRHTFLCKQIVKVGALNPVHGTVVAMTKGVQLKSLAMVCCHLGLVCQHSCRLQVNVMGMESVARNGTVWAGIHPVAALCGVVDGQKLYHFHPGLHSPVNHPAQVSEVSNTVRVAASQGKHRHCESGGAPHLFPDVEYSSVEHKHLAVGNCAVACSAVASFLPFHQSLAAIVHHNILVFQRKVHYPHHVYRQHPFLSAGVLHGQIARFAPVAYGRMTSAHAQRLPRLKLWSRDAEHDGAPEQWEMEWFGLFVGLIVSGGEVCAGVKVMLQRYVAPTVRHEIVFCRVEKHRSRHTVPLTSQDIAVGILYLIYICERLQGALARLQGCGLQCPNLAVVGVHRQVAAAQTAVTAFVDDVHMKSFSPNGVVCQPEVKFHLLCFCRYVFVRQR